MVDIKIMGVICLYLVCSSVATYVVIRQQRQNQERVINKNSVPAYDQMPVYTPPPPSATTTPVQTTALPATPSPPPRNQDIMIYSPGYPYVLYPYGYYGPRYPVPPMPQYPQPWWPPRPRPVQPGGSFPELMKKDKDDAVSYLMSTYPNMTVAAVRYGAPSPSDSRHDRFIVVYDAWTRKVVDAKIG